MKIPIDNYKNILTALKLEHFAPLLDYFDYEGRKLLAIYIITNILENETLIPTLEQVDAVLSMVSPLVQDQLDQPNIEEDPEDFAEEQGLLGRLIHHFKSETADQQYMILSAARKHFSAGGNKRIKYNLSKAKQYCTNCKQHICKKHSNSVIIYETCEELNSDVSRLG